MNDYVKDKVPGFLGVTISYKGNIRKFHEIPNGPKKFNK